MLIHDKCHWLNHKHILIRELQYWAQQNNFQVNSQDYMDMAQHFQNASRDIMFGLRPHENHVSARRDIARHNYGRARM